MLWINFFAGFDAEMCTGDFETEMLTGGRSLLLAPGRAWRRHQKALDEISTNPFTLMTDPEFGNRAYQQRIAPWQAVGGLLGSVITGVVIAKAKAIGT